MSRIPRKIAGLGASDLPDAAAFDAYVGPAREITVDQQRGIIALHDGTAPGGYQFRKAEIASYATFDSYDAADAAPKLPEQNHISALVNGRLVEWVRDPAGPCLSGGWVPAGNPRPEHFGFDPSTYEDTPISYSGARPRRTDVQRYTVGDGANFPTINAALDFLSQTQGVGFSLMPPYVYLQLRSGFVMEEQVIVHPGVDLSWVTIVAQDPVVSIRRTAMTEMYDLSYPAFRASRGAKLPTIAAQFEFDNSGPVIAATGVQIIDGAFGIILQNSGVRNCPSRGLHVANSSNCVARGTDWSNSGYAGTYEDGGAAVRITGSQVEIRESNVSNSAIGIKISGPCSINASQVNGTGCGIGVEILSSASLRLYMADFSGSGVGIYAADGANIEAWATKFANCTTRGVELRQGSHMAARSCNISGCNGHGVYVSSSYFFGANCNLKNINGYAFYGIGGSSDIPNADVTGTTGNGVYATHGHRCNAQDVNATGVGDGVNTFGFSNMEGSWVNANGATGSSRRTENSVSRHGLILR